MQSVGYALLIQFLNYSGEQLDSKVKIIAVRDATVAADVTHR